MKDHPWIKEDGEAPDKPIDNAVLNRLKQFRAMNQFKKVALRVIFMTPYRLEVEFIDKFCYFSSLNLYDYFKFF